MAVCALFQLVDAPFLLVDQTAQEPVGHRRTTDSRNNADPSQDLFWRH
jgi:hypothetical protein